MRTFTLVLLVALSGCGGTDETLPDGGVQQKPRGVRGTGPADAGGIWAIAEPCDGGTACPFADAGGFCGTGQHNFCVVPPYDTGCPSGAASGATVSVASCLKTCAGAPDCAPGTNCYNGFCVPF